MWVKDRATRHLLLTAVLGGVVRGHKGQLFALVLAIALGVAMVLAIDLINRSGLAAFEDGIQTLAGGSDLTLRPVQGAIPDAWLETIRAMPEVWAAYPALRLRVRVGHGERSQVLPLLGVDTLDDAELRGVYVGAEGGRLDSPTDLFDRGCVVLGAGAARGLGVGVGGRLRTQIGGRTVELRVIGLLPEGSPWDHGMVMDIAPAQWTFQRPGELDRIDVVLRDRQSRPAFAAALERHFGKALNIADAGVDRRRARAMSRAYRVNLNILSMVGLLTAGFLVFSLLGLALRRRREHLALLRTLGLDLRRLALLLLVEGLALGVVGSGLGLALGVGLAWLGVQLMGGDLGAGYFQTVSRGLWWNPAQLAVYFLLGLGITLVASLPPVWDNLRRLGAVGLRRGSSEDRGRLSVGQRAWLSAAALLGAGLLALLPARGGLPIAGYFSITALLAAGVWSFPLVLHGVLRYAPPIERPWLLAMALAQLRGATRRAATAGSAVLVSFALVVAMSSMVYSFRDSLVDWLRQVLVADVYITTSQVAGAYLAAADVQAVRSWSEVRGVSRARHLDLRYGDDPESPPVHLSARDLMDPSTRPEWGMLRGDWSHPDREAYVSEVFAGLYGAQVGQTIELALPICTSSTAGLSCAGTRVHKLLVGGVFRDYAYQWGQVLMDYGLWRRLTADPRIDDLGVYLRGDAPAAEQLQQLQRRLQQRYAELPGVEIRNAGRILRTSLEVFDRSFAVTYVLVFIALGVGLFGIANSQALQALERRGEAGMLRHFGFLPRQIALLSALEAVFVTLAGALQGLLTGLLIGLVLIHVVNRQSFLWGMDTVFPWGELSLALVGMVLVAALFGYRQGLRLGRQDPMRAVRDE